MTDKKISELTSITGANVSDANDVLPIVDTSVATTKKITRAELFKSVSSVDLAAIAETKAVTAVDVFVYDTSKDSDGGAWRKRTQHTSWYNETLNTATRGSRREFPAVAVIVAETSKLTIYDGDDPSLPMWMVFNNGGTNALNVSTGINSVTAMNGLVLRGSTPTGSYDLAGLHFLYDGAARIGASGVYGPYLGNIEERNDTKSFANGVATFFGSGQIISRTVNDVAMTVLPDAPIDPATGLPVPTIAVATDGGVSVIADNGSVYDSSETAGMAFVAFNSSNRLFYNDDASDQVYYADTYAADGFSDGHYDTDAAPYTLPGNVTDLTMNAIGQADGLTVLAEDPDTQASGMVSYITSSYQTGYMNGDIKGAFLSDTDDTDLIATDTISDRSVNGLTLTLGDSCTVAAVATGADLVGYTFASSETVTLGTDISSTGALIWWEEVSGVWHCYVNDLSGGTDYDNGASKTAGTGLTISGTTLTFAASKKMALARATATIPTADQIAKIYNDEKVLFQENAQATLYGSSDAVTALAHDPVTDLLHVGTSAGRSVFSGLRRVSNTTTAVGTAISAQAGLVVEE